MGCSLANPQCLAMNGRSKNPVVAQSMGLDVSTGLSRCWNPEEIGSNASERMGLLAR